MSRPRKPASPFRYFNSSPEIIRLAVLMYIRFPLSLRNVEDLLFEREVDICHEKGADGVEIGIYLPLPQRMFDRSSLRSAIPRT